MYMSGNSLQIFSIMMVMMAFKNPLMGLLATNTAFARYESDGIKGQLLIVKATYIALQFVAMALGIWKVNQMGLLPYVCSYLALAVLTVVQNYEVRLAGVGDGETAT